MSTAENQRPTAEYSRLLELTLRGCAVARAAAVALADGMSSGSAELFNDVAPREEELDTLDREINEGVTSAITQVSPKEARELLSCLKFIIELERIGDLLLGFGNRARTVAPRLEPQDTKDLSTMAAILVKMLDEDYQAFQHRDVNLAVSVLRADSELDRLRNLLFVRHIENPDNVRRQESFHLVFMSQLLERAGDHAKNLAEEVVHLVTGRSVRHLLRQQDKPIETMFVEFMRRRELRKR
ncbi:MAG: phosphate uptake regulator PhoU [Terriglobales bacterium]